MDDYNVNILYESRNEWSARLVSILTPHIIAGYRRLFADAVRLCKASGENEKYLMTFQNVISQIPKWNATTIEKERVHISKESGCNYLDDLITCVHITQLKILSAMRVGQKQKKIDITIPKLDDFIHKAYITVARKVYKNVYLFQVGVSPLKIQQNQRGLELIVQECILHTIRDNIPEETLLRAYLGETIEEKVTEEIQEIAAPMGAASSSATPNGFAAEQPGPPAPEPVPAPPSLPTSRLSFNDTDYARTADGSLMEIHAPKTPERLDGISAIRFQERKLEDLSSAAADDSGENLSIGGSITDLPDLVLDDIAVL